jgi:uncharacterized membrane protein YsdA (DUF1294 family)
MPSSDSRSGRERSRGLTLPAATLLLALLVAPTLALAPLTAWLDWRGLAGAALLLSVFTFFSYRADKRRAEAGEWRIPESTLHLASLAGGWPGAFLAQQFLRHKTAKISFQIPFWLIVMLHQFLAIDSLLGWRLTAQMVHLIKS